MWYLSVFTVLIFLMLDAFLLRALKAVKNFNAIVKKKKECSCQITEGSTYLGSSRVRSENGTKSSLP